MKKNVIDSDSFCAAALNEIPDMVRLIDKNHVVHYENKAFVDRFGQGLNIPCYKIPGATDNCKECIALDCIKTKSRKTIAQNVKGRVYSVNTSPVVFDC